MTNDIFREKTFKVLPVAVRFHIDQHAELVLADWVDNVVDLHLEELEIVVAGVVAVEDDFDIVALVGIDLDSKNIIEQNTENFLTCI